VLLNNAAVAKSGDSFEGLDNWKTVMDVNLFGYVTASRGNYVVDVLL
jgi:NAD(P)-dependent dehydrogenase (short-subunit alcohol dehydrogenase family)